MIERFKTLFKEESIEQKLQKDIAESYEEMQDGQLSQCSKCGSFKHLEDFRNASPKTDTDKTCNACRNELRQDMHRNGGNRSKKMVRERPECPSCGLPMKLKRGGYGLFYGCPRYPMCRYTLPVF
ncbi:MAG: topoisomerase DNA-binding C4 zinc finger domain-containing protein [Deltaproteobacteria bacterium]